MAVPHRQDVKEERECGTSREVDTAPWGWGSERSLVSLLFRDLFME